MIDGTGVLAQTDEQPSRAQCIGKYEALTTVRPDKFSIIEASAAQQSTAQGEVAGSSDKLKVTTDGAELSSLPDAGQPSPLAPPSVTNGSHTSEAALPQQAPSLDLAPLGGSQVGSGTVPPSFAISQSGKRKTATAKRAVAAAGSNLNVEAEYETTVSWEQIREGGATRRVGERQTAATPSSGTKGAGQRSSTSRLCGRQWGQDGVAAELCGIANAAVDADQEARDASDSYDSFGLSDRRFFIGATAKAVKVSRANRTYAKLQASKKLSLQPPAGPTDANNAIAAAPQQQSQQPTGAGAPVSRLLHADSVTPPPFVSEPAPAATTTGAGPEEGLFRAVLKPQERLQVAVVVCPSADHIDANTGAKVSADFVAREMPLTLRWQLLGAPDGSAESQTGADRSGTHSLCVRVRTCQSVISVNPSDLYELGMCNVGEQRSLVLEVTNQSPLPALVFPYTRSDVLDASEQEELLVPPLDTRQLRVSYLAREEQAEYWDRVVLLNAYNDAGHREVKIKARNLDTEQIVLHSMFYKLVTYNSMRQLQVCFDRGLFNMPNLRVFSVKNVHTRPLRMTFSWSKQAGMRLFLVVTPASGAGADEGGTATSASSRIGADLVVDTTAPAGSLSRPGTSRHAGQGPSSSQQQQQLDDLEDLKWGDNALEFSSAPSASTSASTSGSTGTLSKSLTRLTMKRTMSLYSKGASGVAGDDGAINYGKGSVTDAKQPSHGVSSADIVSVLDLSQTPALLPSVVATAAVATTVVGVAAHLLNGVDSASVEQPSPTPLSKQSSDSIREVRFLDTAEPAHAAPATGEPTSAVRSAEAPALSAGGGATAAASLPVKMVELYGRDSFPFSLVDECVKHTEDSQVLPKLAADPASEERGRSGKDVSSKPTDSGRPHSFGATLTTGPEGTAISHPKEREKSEAELCVKRVQQMYADLRAAIDGSCGPDSRYLDEVPLDPPQDGGQEAEKQVCASVTIPLGATVRFAVVYEPQQRAEFEDPEEYTQVRVSESLHIHLPEVGAAEVAACVERDKRTNAVLSPVDDPHLQDDVSALPAGGLRPRSLPIRATLVRSEMVVIQKNINFGRTVLNDKSSRGVTVVNRSSVPCLYSISKSGSISSGFLQVLGGRKGIIPPFSSKVIEFIFKPSMAGNFEEVLMINNVLNPKDAQAVTIKAKVHNTETFVLSAVAPATESPAAPDPATPQANELGAAESNDAVRLVKHLASVSAPPSQVSATKAISRFLGTCTMGADTTGPQSSHVVSFRVRNVTSKSRQFIVDATHAHAVELLIAPTAVNSPSAADGNDLTQSPTAVLPTSPDKLVTSTPFEPIPEVLQSILSLRCRFDSEVVRGGGGAGEAGGAGDGSLSREERKQLEDSLEQFQQKLKIAIRKNKQEKIDKYQKKIDKVITALQENRSQAPGTATIKPAPSSSTIATADGSVECGGGEAAGDAPLPSQPAFLSRALPPVHPPQSLLSVSQPSTSNESEVSYHFQLEPEQERIVHVRLTFLPGTSYRSWSGLLPFHGFLRVFECKNEDHIKVVHFGAMVRTGRLSVPSAVPFSQSEEVSEPLESPGMERRDSIVEYRSLAADVPFITTVAQWSSLPTREIYPKYRQLPQNLLPVCVKLVRASNERVMHGSFSVASLLEHAGALSLSVDDDFSAKASPQYYTYNAQKHGELLFALVSSFGGLTATEQEQPADVVLGEAGSLAAEIGSKPATRSKKDSIVRTLTHQSSSKLKAGSKVDFSVQWRPPMDLAAASGKLQGAHIPSTTAGTSDEGQTALPQALRIAGAIKVQLRVGDRVVGQAQSIPFVGVLEHVSSFTVAKHFVCEGACVGSYRTYQLPVQNTSDQELHYVVSSEEVAAASKGLGSVEIVSGQTGIIRPGGSKQVTLLFSASAAGRFEQKLWVRNIRDTFDQKRVVVQANIAVAQTKFVIFPDLDSADSQGKYKTVDLGLIQSQSSAAVDPQLEAVLPREADARCFYELRIQNVSGKPLSVTAVSNLKSQCFIYADEDCRQLAIFAPLPTAAITTLYVKIRPSAVGTADAPSTAEGAEGAGAESRKVAAAAGGQRGVRELMGGIKLVFFTADTAPAPTSAESSVAIGTGQPADSFPEGQGAVQVPLLLSEANRRKLFETNIAFKATVGRSSLKLASGPAPSLRCLPAADPAVAPVQAFSRRFELRNSSKTFHLDYAYVLRPGDSCVGASVSGIPPSELSQPTELTKGELRMYIADSASGRLEPGESKWVSCWVQCAAGCHGVVLCTVRVGNISTMEMATLTLSTFLDPGRVSCDAQSLLEQSGAAHSAGAADGEASFEARRMGVLRSDTCLWAYRNSAELAARVADLSSAAVRGKSGSDPTEAPPGTAGALMTAADAMIVQGSSPAEVCAWTVCNSKDKAIIVFPATDLPVEVALVRPHEESSADAAVAVPVLAARSDSDLDVRQFAPPPTPAREYGSSIAPALLRWKQGLVRCGDTYTLEPGVMYRVVVRARTGAVVKDKQAGLQEGKVVQLQGVVVLLQAAHSLQSLFDPSRPREGSAVPAQSPTAEGAPQFTEAGTSSAAAQQFSVIPVVSVSHVACTLASPLLRLPVKDVALGRRRYGATASFQVCIENPSEVDVPACLDSLPPWITIDKFALSSLAPLLRGEDWGASLDWDGATGKSSSSRATVAQKLHWWIASNGATISGTGGAATPKRRGSRDSSITFEEWQLALSDAESVAGDGGSIAESGQAVSAGTGTADEDEALTATGDTESVVGRARANSAELQRQFQSDQSLDAFDAELIRARRAAAGGPGTALRFFGIPAQSRIYLNMQTKVPVVSTAVLQHVLRIKNLSSCLVSGAGSGNTARYLFDEQGAVLVADEHRLSVTVEVDATPALEVIAAIDEPLVPRSQLVFEGGAAASSSGVPPSNHAPLARLLKDPIIVPPPVEVTLDEGADLASGNFPLPVHAKSKIAKSHCRFSVKNKLPGSVRVRATSDICTDLVGLLDFKVKFQTNNSDAIDLVHEESSAVKVRIVPKQSARLGGLSLVCTKVTLKRLPSGDGAAENKDRPETARSGTPALQAPLEPNVQDASTTVVAGAATGAATVAAAGGTGLSRESPASTGQASTSAAPASTKQGGTAVDQRPVRLLGSVVLTPHMLLGDGGAGSAEAAESALASDVVTVHMLGYLQAGPTVAASVTAPLPAAPASASAATAAAAGTVDAAVPAAAASSESTGTAVVPVVQPATAAVHPVLEFRAVPAGTTSAQEPPATGAESQSAKIALSSAVNPLLRLKAPSITFYLTNPSTTTVLNYFIRTQSYRHAGMSLQLPTTGADASDAYDTFTVVATPPHGSLPPSTVTAVTLTLVPGNPTSAVKAASTLTADIPDPLMRERRLRSHHKEGTAPAGGGGVPNSSSAPRLTPSGSQLLSAASAADVPAPAPVPAPPAQAPASTSVPATAPPAAQPRAEPVGAVLPAQAPLAPKSGPYTLACMPVEVCDTDHAAHPPRVLWVYLTSEVALAVIPTQSVRESAAAKSAGHHAKRGLVRIPSEMGDHRFAPITEGEATPHSIETLVHDREDSALFTPRTPAVHLTPSTRSAEETVVTLGPSGEGARRMLTLDAGYQTQRKEYLEWAVTVENAADADTSFAVLPAVAEDAHWLIVGQTGGLLPARGHAVFMLYAKRSVPTGSYVSYVLIQDRASPGSDRVVRVHMEVVPETKRAQTAPPPLALKALSNSADNLAALAQTSEIVGKESSKETSGAGCALPTASTSTTASTDCLDLTHDSVGSSCKLTGRTSPQQQHRAEKPPASRLSSSALDQHEGSGKYVRVGAIERPPTVVELAADREHTSCKPLFRVQMYDSAAPTHSVTDALLRSFSSEEVMGGSAVAVGMSLTPSPSPSLVARKHAAQPAAVHSIELAQHLQGQSAEWRTVGVTISSSADVAVALVISCSPAVGSPDATLAIAVEGDGNGSYSGELPMCLPARASVVLTVRAPEHLAPLRLALRLEEPAPGCHAEPAGPGHSERVLGHVLICAPLFPDQLQVYAVVAV
jgi:hypothetical protein